MLADGRAAFVKHALTTDAAQWLRKERLLYESVEGSFMPVYFGAYDDGTTLLVLEDLSHAEWPPPSSPERIDAVLASLDELHQTRPPPGVDSLDAMRESVVGWSLVAADPEPLLLAQVARREPAGAPMGGAGSWSRPAQLGEGAAPPPPVTRRRAGGGRKRSPGCPMLTAR